MSPSMEIIAPSDLRPINMSMRTWTRFLMMSYQLMLRKMNLNKTKMLGDGGITVVPCEEGTRLHEFTMLPYHTDRTIFEEILMRQLSWLLAVQ
jgi:hypothetical protein